MDNYLNEQETLKLLVFIKEQLIRRPSVEITSETSLLRSGLIDSMSSVDLASFLEENFNVKIPDYAVTAENMDSVELIMTYVYKIKQGDTSQG